MAPSIRARPAYLQARNPRLSLFSSSLVVVVVVVMVCASLKFPRVRMGKVGVCTYIHGGLVMPGCTVGVLLGVVCYDII